MKMVPISAMHQEAGEVTVFEFTVPDTTPSDNEARGLPVVVTVPPVHIRKHPLFGEGVSFLLVFPGENFGVGVPIGSELVMRAMPGQPGVAVIVRPREKDHA